MISVKRLLSVFACILAAVTVANAQNNNSLTAVFSDASNKEPVSFATVSLTKKGETKPYKYVLSTADGKAQLDKVAAGTYILKCELLGYKTYEKEIEVKGKMDLGTIEMEVDQQALNAASVSAVGNPIIIKKDTVEYNATSFRTTENDMLEDLLKKLPGVEVSEDGTITQNGKTISKITIDGKTFFLDDPQLASKNLPAKIINKVKVVQKKSEQAEFTGIDDGQEETVIDLTVHKGMMNGVFGNVSAGGGHDVKGNTQTALGANTGDPRYQGGAFIGRFTDKSQISFILNGNNTNNRGFNDLSGGMMQGMRGGGGGMGRGQGGWGGGNGITTSWMGGLNGAWDLFDDKMQLGSNYAYNNTRRVVQQQSLQRTYLEDGSNLLYRNGLTEPGFNRTNSNGHRFGMRLEHKFSENTSILFQPQLNFGRGDYHEFSDFETSRERGSSSSLTNKGFNNNLGSNDNWTTNGFLLFRQRLGIPGRTVSLMTNYNFSNNDLDGYNQSLTNTYVDGAASADIINQRFQQNSRGASVNSRLSYTEPLGKGFYAEANYSFGWSRNKSLKDTYDSGSNDTFSQTNPLYVADNEKYNDTYSSSILNRYINQTAGVNLQYQRDKMHAQIGFSANPTNTHNETNGKSYDSKVLNWAPSAMFWFDKNENTNIRIFYFGRSAQPSTSQLMPVPDNTNPLSVALGNPYLKPYFNHNIRSEYRMTNKQTFTTVNFELNGGFVQAPIVSAVWYDAAGAQYSLPVNGPVSGNGNARLFINSPIAKSQFSIFSMTFANFSQNASYVGKSSFDMSPYDSDNDGVFDDYEKFHADFPDMDASGLFTKNKTQSVGFTQALRLTFRNDFVELVAGGRTRMNRAWYTITTSNQKTTWSNQVNGTMTWTIPGGIELRTDARYNWYRGYVSPQEDEIIINAELNKFLFKKTFTLSLRAYDILNQSKNLTVTDANNYHSEVLNNTLGRYVIVALTYRFGTFSGNRNGGMMGGPMGGRGPMGGGRPGGR